MPLNQKHKLKLKIILFKILFTFIKQDRLFMSVNSWKNSFFEKKGFLSVDSNKIYCKK